MGEYPYKENVAYRSFSREAREHFESGGDILVSTRDVFCFDVAPRTNILNRETWEWSHIIESMDMWKNRYGKQFFYIIPRPQRRHYVRIFHYSDLVAEFRFRTADERVDALNVWCDLLDAHNRAAGTSEHVFIGDDGVMVTAGIGK